MFSRDEVISAQTPQRVLDRVARERQGERSTILDIAQTFVARDDRQDGPTVMIVAIPLLAWVNEASDKLDRDARLSALNKVHYAGLTKAVHVTVPASTLIARASVYYQFMIAE